MWAKVKSERKSSKMLKGVSLQDALLLEKPMKVKQQTEHPVAVWRFFTAHQRTLRELKLPYEIASSGALKILEKRPKRAPVREVSRGYLRPNQVSLVCLVNSGDFPQLYFLPVITLILTSPILWVPEE